MNGRLKPWGRAWIQGAGRAAASIGLKPWCNVMTGVDIEDEGLFVVRHKYWQEALQRAPVRPSAPAA